MHLSCNAFTYPAGRPKNEDFCAHLIEKEWGCFIVADGLGGHPKGEVASKEFCQAVIAKAPEHAESIAHDPERAIEHLLNEAHQKMRETITAAHGLVDAHTTFVLAWVTDNFVLTANVGDSRIYRLSRDAILWRTADHTLVQTLFDEGKISEEDMLTHPLQNRLLRTVSVLSLAKPDIQRHAPLAAAERLLLCTDGFWTKMIPKDMLELIYSKTLEADITDWANRTVAADPKSDNITLEVIQAD